MSINENETEILLRLLQGSGVVVREEIDSARTMAQNLNLPVIEAIKRSGMLSDSNLSLALELQQRITHRQLTFDVAIRALRIAMQKLVSIDEAISSVNRLHEKTRIVVSATNELTTLLIQTKFISSEDLGRLIKLSQDSSMMIGHLLVMDNRLTPAELISSLDAVVALRGKVMESVKATQALRYARQKDIAYEQALYELDFFQHVDDANLQERDLFTMAGAISREDLAECYEIEVLKMKVFGQILLERALVTSYQLQCAGSLVDLVVKGKLKPYQAAHVLDRICNHDEKLDSALDSVSPTEALQKPTISFPEFLLKADALASHELTMALVPDYGVPRQQMETLANSQILDKDFLVTALRLYSIHLNGYLDIDDSVDILRFCKSKSRNLDKTLDNLKVYIPQRAQWTWLKQEN
ncbi:MAG: hypothetical protein R3C24_02125 [Cyanobacteriota/Melainabacteria group bacterium]|nr:hypothetical protein [Cyanobacteria bacterium HKST-UBA01]MCB9471961.1 hypothetical protein [Candidatus Obscuribacterales bacterium]